MSSRYITPSHTAVLGRRGRHRRLSTATLVSHRVLAGAVFGSLVTFGAAAAPAAAASHGSTTQGGSQSDPDGAGNGGADKTGSTGGVNKADQDGNNGSGNDSDCEDDNNGAGTPGACAAHASNAERTAAREQTSSSTQTTVSAAAHARASAQTSARADARDQRDQVRAEALALRSRPHGEAPASGNVAAAVIAADRQRASIGAQAKLAARQAIEQIRVELRAGTITKAQAEEQVAAIRASLRTQMVQLRTSPPVGTTGRVSAVAGGRQEVGPRVSAVNQARAEAQLEARIAAGQALEQIRAELRAGTITRAQAEERISTVRGQLHSQVAALQVTAALQRHEMPGATVPGATVPSGVAVLPNTVTAPSTSASAPRAVPSGSQVLGTRLGTTTLSVAASRVPASARSAASFAAVTAPSATSMGLLPHTGADSVDLARLAGLGLGAVVVGAGLTVVTRRRRVALEAAVVGRTTEH